MTNRCRRRLFRPSCALLLSLGHTATAGQEPLAWRLITPEGHDRAVASAAFSADGRHIVSTSFDHTAMIWETASGRLIGRLVGHTWQVDRAAFSPDGRFVATVSSDSTARLWDLSTWREVRRFGDRADLQFFVAFSPDGRLVFTADETAITLWETSTGREVRRLATGRIRSADLSSDGRLMATTSGDTIVRLWDVASGQEVRRLDGHTGPVTFAAFPREGGSLATLSWNGTVSVWDVASGRETRRFPTSAEAWSPALSPDGRQIVIGQPEVRAWDIATGREIDPPAARERGPAAAVKFSPDGKLFLVADPDRGIELWDVANRREVRRLEGRIGNVGTARFSSDGRFVVMVTEDTTALVWELATGRQIARLRGHTQAIRTAAFSSDGRFVFTVSRNGTARLWEAQTGRQIHQFDPHEDIFSAGLSPDGQWVITSTDRNARLWEITTGRELALDLDGHESEVTSVALSGDNRFFLTASNDETARLWELPGGREIRRFQGHSDYVNSAVFSPDGQSVLTASDDETARLWDSATGREIRRFQGHSSEVNTAVFSPDGRFVLTSANDQTARLWDAETGREIRRFEHRHWVHSAEFSPSGRLVLTTSFDGTLRLWDADSGAELFRRLDVDSDNWIVVAPDGRFDGTEAALTRMHYARGMQTIGLSAFFETFFTPGLSGDIAAGSAYTGPDIRHGFGLPPSVSIVAPSEGDTVGAEVTVAIAATEHGGGVEDIRLYHNGAFVSGTSRGIGRVSDGCPASATCFSLELLPGANVLEATAFSSARVEAERARVSVFVAGERPTATLHVVAVGINEYEQERYDLNYGRADAEAFVDSLLAGAESIYDQVVVDTLFDRAATGLAIKAAFRRVAARAEPQDVFVFFYAGHGIADETDGSTRFFLVPSDVTEMTDPEQLAQRAVSNLGELFDAVPALKKVMLIDACQSGQMVAGFTLRGAAEEMAIARLAHASGIFVMTAAASDQLASEVATLGHGVFTYAWLRAMRRDDTGPRMRLVGTLADEVEDMIPELARDHRARPQRTILFRNGQNWPLIVR